MTAPRTTRTPALLLLPLLLVAVLATACGGDDGDEGSGSTIRLGWLKSTADLAAYRAEEVAAEDIDIQSTLFTTAVDVQTALVGGQIDVGMLTPVHLLRAVEKGEDLVQISGNTRGNTGILFAADLGLEYDDWDGLKQILAERKLRIATSRGSINEALAIAEFAANGIDVNEDVELVNIANFAQHAEGVRLGEFDGVFTMETFASVMAVDGTATMFSKPYNTEAGDINTIFVANRSWVEANPEAAQAFVQTIADASAELEADREFEVEVAMELMGLEREVIELALDNNRYENAIGLDQTKALATIQLDLGLLERDISDDIDAHVTDEFVEAVTP